MGSASAARWGPLRHEAYRRLWLAQFVANSGTWAQTVGAQWLMGDLGGNSLQIALIQTAATLPVFLLVLPSGALGDILDRRRLLLASHVLMFCAAIVLTGLTVAGLMTPTLLLAGTALLACGVALAAPTFSAIQPELVPREEIAHASLLNGANLNVARAVGPAIGGVLISLAGPEATFALNAVSYLVVIAAIYIWDRPPEHRPLGTEHLRHAIRAGGRYVRRAPAFATVLARGLLFSVFASAVWALLPVVARGPLGLSATGYGALLACIGVGAVVGAVVIPSLRRRLRSNDLVAVGTILIAAAYLVTALSDSVAIVAPTLFVGGFAAVMVTTSLMANAQLLLPNWTRARALAFYSFTYMGGTAIGSVAWGALANEAGLRTAIEVSAAGLLIGPLLGVRWLGLRAAGDVQHAKLWPEPTITIEPDPLAGPVLVTIEWEIDPANGPAFVRIMRQVGGARRRTGATLWGLYQDLADPDTFVETFAVHTWHEHLRQHSERQTIADQELEVRARSFLREGAEPRIRHLLWAFHDTPDGHVRWSAWDRRRGGDRRRRPGGGRRVDDRREPAPATRARARR